MNIHHLELFYFVAKHGGIAAAVRNIPYGIQQPAVSGQIAKLEESLGTKLFQRRPFALSPTGTELFEFIRPFFENIDVVAERLRQNSFAAIANRGSGDRAARLSAANLATRSGKIPDVPALSARGDSH
jgi:DNA-binding transcriptional LysR family regulator